MLLASAVVICLDDAEINADYQYAISNEVLPEKTAEITLRKGRLLLIKILESDIMNKTAEE